MHLPEDAAFRAEVMDRIRGLRAAVAFATVLSLIAVALSAWMLLVEDDDRDGRGGARATEVEGLEQRVEQLETRPDQKGVAPTDFDALADEQAGLATQVEDLSIRVEELAAAQQDAGTAPATAEDPEAREAIEALDQSVADLDARVQALEQQAP